MLLTYNELVGLVESGAIEGVEPDQINGASIDLTLGDDFLVEDKRPAASREDGAVELSAHAFCRHAGKELLGHIVVMPIASNTINIRRVEAD